MKKQLISLFIMFFVCATPSFAQHETFLLNLIEGRAQLSRTKGSTWLTLQPVQPFKLIEGDMLKIENNAKVTVFYPDGSEIKIKDETILTLMLDGIQLQKGNLWLNIRKRSDIFKVITPFASCHVLGTSFDIDTDKFGHTKVRVFSGIVAVRALEDKSKKQIVLQEAMTTTISDSSKLPDKPSKFNAQLASRALESEWSERSLLKISDVSKIKPAQPTDLQQPPPVEEIIDSLKYESPKQDSAKISIMPRQRLAFYEEMQKQQINKNSSFGLSQETTKEMKRDSHGYEIGQYYRLPNRIDDQKTLSSELFVLKNHLLRLQSIIRQKESEANSLIRNSSFSPAQQRRISVLQTELIELEKEHRTLARRIRDLQSRSATSAQLDE